MDARKERRGRKGGTANAGAFYNYATKGKWYSTSSIKAYFESKGVTLHYQEARAIFDALRRCKCYPTEEKQGPKGRKGHVRPFIKFIEKKPDVLDVPYDFKEICGQSIKEYLINFLLTRKENEPMKTRRMTYEINDSNLKNIALLQDKKKDIWFDGLPYEVVAWDKINSKIVVLFNQKGAV